LNRLWPIEDGINQLHALEAQITEQKYRNITLQHQLDTIKLERTKEVWNLKKKNDDLALKNKSLAKIHRGNILPTTLFIVM
jgi:hypothetical protein